MYLARKIIVAISIGATGIVVVATGRTFGDAGRTFLGDVCEMGYATRHKMAKLYSWRGFADINIRNTAPNGVLRDTMRLSVRCGAHAKSSASRSGTHHRNAKTGQYFVGNFRHNSRICPTFDPLRLC